MFKFNSKLLTNPFYLYVVTNFIVFIIYAWGWSSLLPDLSVGLVIFFTISSFVMIVLGYLLDQGNFLPPYQPIYNSYNSSLACFLLYSSFCLEFIANGGIPLFMYGGLDLDYDYTLFGIKTLHPILITFSSFYSVYLFHRYISTKNSKFLIQVILLSLYPILIMNRGALLLNLSSMLIVYLSSLRYIYFRKILSLVMILLGALYLFGVAGDYRSGGTNILVDLFQPSDAFISSNFPNEFLWPYLYITSPLGNLQATINSGLSQSTDVIAFVYSAMVPDFISKHLDFQPAVITKIAPFLTVGGIYSASYVFMGYVGMVLTYIFVVLFVLLYLFLLPRHTPYTTTGMAILATLIIFNIFDNMIVFSGLSFQLIYSLILGFAYKINFLRYLKRRNGLVKLTGRSDEV